MASQLLDERIDPNRAAIACALSCWALDLYGYIMKVWNELLSLDLGCVNHNVH